MTLALALWILVSPLDLPGTWGWTIIGGPFESPQACHQARQFRLDSDTTQCVQMPARPWFVPGQYCVLGMNNADKPELGSVRRSMSIASAPEDEGPIEFYIRWVAKPKNSRCRLLKLPKPYGFPRRYRK